MSATVGLLLFRLGFAVFVALLGTLIAVKQDKDYRTKLETRFQPIAAPVMLPFLLFVCFPVLALLFRWSFSYVLLVIFNLLLTLFVYSLILLALTPLLRRRVSARGLAMFWSLPSFFLSTIYVHIILMDHRMGGLSTIPLLTLRLSRTTMRVLFCVWAAGFLGVLGWKILSHLRFRKAVLRDAEPLSNRELALFKEACNGLWVREPYRPSKKASRKLRFYRSPAAKTPLSVGLLPKTTCLVLPQRDYTDEELQLIFRHEIVHLLHQDNNMKFSIAFLCAAGWFLPCLWGGMGKASEELELCCDELAAGALDEEDRRRYAGLLLDAAGPAPGFTTCLSASASGLRYRMERVLHPAHRSSGILIFGVLLAFVVFLYGSFGLAIDAGSFGDAVFRTTDVSQVRLGANAADDASWPELLAAKQVYRADYSVDLGENYAGFFCHDEENAWYLYIGKETARVQSYKIVENDGQCITIKAVSREVNYLFDEPIDVSALDALLRESDSSGAYYLILRD